jgi:hypothetical protein
MEVENRIYLNDEIVYSINVEDLQNVASDLLDRNLTSEEIKIAVDKLGDYIDWYEAVESSIREAVKNNAA